MKIKNENLKIEISLETEKEARLFYLIFLNPNLREKLFSGHQHPNLTNIDTSLIKTDFDYEDRNKICKMINNWLHNPEGLKCF